MPATSAAGASVALPPPPPPSLRLLLLLPLSSLIPLSFVLPVYASSAFRFFRSFVMCTPFLSSFLLFLPLSFPVTPFTFSFFPRRCLFVLVLESYLLRNLQGLFLLLASSFTFVWDFKSVGLGCRVCLSPRKLKVRTPFDKKRRKRRRKEGVVVGGRGE